MFETERLQEALIISGVKMPYEARTLFDDLQELGRRYAKIKPKIRHQRKPVYTMVMTGEEQLFMGDVTTEADRSLETLRLEKGKLVVKVPVPYHMQASLTMKAAKLRKRFYQDWLPGQPYACARWRDAEVYHYRQRYFRKSVKMVMELWFFLDPKS